MTSTPSLKHNTSTATRMKRPIPFWRRRNPISLRKQRMFSFISALSNISNRFIERRLNINIIPSWSLNILAAQLFTELHALRFRHSPLMLQVTLVPDQDQRRKKRRARMCSRWVYRVVIYNLLDLSDLIVVFPNMGEWFPGCDVENQNEDFTLSNPFFDQRRILLSAGCVYDIEDAFLTVDYGGLADTVVRCGFMCAGEVVEAELNLSVTVKLTRWSGTLLTRRMSADLPTPSSPTITTFTLSGMSG